MSLDSIRRPEYTGSNRCLPCTLVNLVVLAGIVGVLALARRRRFALVVGTVGSLAIALRGYVIPYTPQFAPKLVARLPLPTDAFDHLEVDSVDPGSLADTDERHPGGDAIFEALLEAGVITLEGEDVALDTTFRNEWEAEMAPLRDQFPDELAAVADELTPATLEAHAEQRSGREYVVIVGDGTRTLLNRPAAIAELAAARVLEGRVDDPIRLAAGRPLRTLLEQCPSCETALTQTSAACCGEVVPAGRTPQEKLICPTCRVRLFTFPDAD